MPRNAVVLLHHCFDPSRFDYESADGMPNSFVRFPKSECTCREYVRFRERDTMIAEGTAVVVLRGGELPSKDRFSWKEIVAVPGAKYPLHARTISEYDIFQAYVGCYPPGR